VGHFGFRSREGDRNKKADVGKQEKIGGINSYKDYIKAYEYQREIKRKEGYERYKKDIKSKVNQLSEDIKKLCDLSKRMEKQFNSPGKPIDPTMLKCQERFVEEYRRVKDAIPGVQNDLNGNPNRWAAGGDQLLFHEQILSHENTSQDSDISKLKKKVERNIKKLSSVEKAQWKQSYESLQAEKWENERNRIEDKYKKGEKYKLNKYSKKIDKFEKEYLDIRQEMKRYASEGLKPPHEVFEKAEKLADKISISRNFEFAEKYNYKELESIRSKCKKELKEVRVKLNNAMKASHFSYEWQTRGINFENFEGRARHQAALNMGWPVGGMKSKESKRQSDKLFPVEVQQPDGRQQLYIAKKRAAKASKEET
jgi:hypothetical protein